MFEVFEAHPAFVGLGLDGPVRQETGRTRPDQPLLHDIELILAFGGNGGGFGFLDLDGHFNLLNRFFGCLGFGFGLGHRNGFRGRCRLLHLRFIPEGAADVRFGIFQRRDGFTDTRRDFLLGYWRRGRNAKSPAKFGDGGFGGRGHRDHGFGRRGRVLARGNRFERSNQAANTDG